VPVRFNAQEVKRITAAESANKQKVLEWFRITLNAATA
jgi:hypothetical protein